MLQTNKGAVQKSEWLGGKGDPLEDKQVIEFWHNYQIVYAQTRICPRKWDS